MTLLCCGCFQFSCLSNVHVCTVKLIILFIADDPQWCNRTILRPSTSFVLTKNASSILNPDSMADDTEVSKNWHKDLSRSDSSKLMEDIVRSKVKNRNNGNNNI